MLRWRVLSAKLGCISCCSPRQSSLLKPGSPGWHHLLQVGCGPGNTAFPLLESNAGMHVWACDSSKEAVRLFRAHPSDARARTQAWVADIVHDDLTAHAPPASMDFCTMVFVLSAIPQTSQLKVICLQICPVCSCAGWPSLQSEFTLQCATRLRAAGPVRPSVRDSPQQCYTKMTVSAA